MGLFEDVHCIQPLASWIISALEEILGEKVDWGLEAFYCWIYEGSTIAAWISGRSSEIRRYPEWFFPVVHQR